EATTIVRGQVRAVETRWTDGRRAIETIVTIDAETYLKGALASRLQFRVPGGELGRFKSITIGAPRFTVGERVILFLSGGAPRVPQVVGLSQGVYRVVASREGLIVTPPPILPGVALGASNATRIVRGDPARRPSSIGDFERRVRDLAVR
ncbi:MAG TPA: hypothetical protein VJP86_13715, partial [Vicinamibacterales bacterium]|nr:hypothetical protein [Vicinamibacterales bacterium]